LASRRVFPGSHVYQKSSRGCPGDRLVQREGVVKSFEEAWPKGTRPVLEDYLPADKGLRKPALIELVHTELELRLKAGEPARVEEYLGRFPDLAEDSAVALELIATERELRRRREPGLGLEDYLMRSPQYRSALASEGSASCGFTARNRPPIGSTTDGGLESAGTWPPMLSGSGASWIRR
jgi:hypothetical protein